MKLKIQRRLAAKILGVGINRIWIDPESVADISTAITRADVKHFIHDGVIRAKPEKGVSRGRVRERSLKRKKGRRRGMGSRRGTARARVPKKERWIKTVRPLRATLRELREKGAIDAKNYRSLYLMIKGGSFRSKAHLKAYLEEHGLRKG